MRLAILPSCPRLRRRLRLLGLCGPSLFTFAVGCAELHSSSGPSDVPIVRGQQQRPDELPRVLPPTNSVQPKAIQHNPFQPIPPVPVKPFQPKLDDVPSPKAPVQQQLPAGRLDFLPSDPSKLVPLSLDTVLRLAETQNGQTAIAREKLREAFANCDLAANCWLPDLWIGTGWYRHDGGLANFNGDLIQSSYGSMFAGIELNGRMDIREATHRKVDAARRVWQQRVEVAKLSTEALLEASTAYVDMLAARAAESIATQIESHLNELLNQTSALAKTLPTSETEVARIQSDLHGQQQLTRKFREAAVVSGAKLIYLLGLDPASELAVMDRSLVAFTLVDADTPGQVLVAQAEQFGPGIRDLGCLLQLIQDANAQANGPGRLLPVFDIRVAEGGFGTGPGGSMDWDDRLDMGLQFRWNLTDWVTSRDQQRLRNAQMCQAQIAYQDLRAKLTMGVQESRETILSSRDQMDIGLRQLKHANEAFERSKARLNQAQIKDRSPNDVLLAIRALNAANLAYLLAIRDHDKGQIRLAILTGVIGGCTEY